MSEPRASPLVSQIVLFVAFALLVVTSIFTVVVPELRDHSGESDAQAEVSPAP